MSRLGSNPWGNHPVLWRQLAPWKTPSLRDPQEALALYPFKNTQQRAQESWPALFCSFETSFHILKQWNSLFAIQINIESLITLFIKSVCRKMRWQSHASQAPQTSGPTSASDPSPFQMLNVNRKAARDEELINSWWFRDSRDGRTEEVILGTSCVFILLGVSRQESPRFTITYLSVIYTRTSITVTHRSAWRTFWSFPFLRIRSPQLLMLWGSVTGSLCPGKCIQVQKLHQAPS